MPNSSEDQQQRRAALHRLLSKGPARTQHALVDALVAEGVTATQSSVSRDLRELGAIKTADGYELPDGESNDRQQMSGIAPLLRRLPKYRERTAYRGSPSRSLASACNQNTASLAHNRYRPSDELDRATMKSSIVSAGLVLLFVISSTQAKDFVFMNFVGWYGELHFLTLSSD